ncbi:G-type lectin S-receptor-like serine/threonine-protein kinase At4g27290 isoform X1 [Arachis duranensis]|uniref:Receptor-like serine/threonine-protein kinase n=1 Tax=Arachis duranensis TaxID=130453 RepID=A0A6P4B566_ARADU|nr:G-type lectin S-receptor-like serine/threonine-protein kinase At4g27290 isoform X1 [Arachis duranensis]
MERFTLLLLCFSLLHHTAISTIIDTISTTQYLTDGDTMLSADENFAIGFFGIPESSMNRYLGIWYYKVPTRTVAWVANRNTPLNDSSGILKITDKGILALHSHNNTIIWHSNSSRFVQRPVAVLLDSGNLIVKEYGSNNNDLKSFLWQSFDYPFDTMLPGMKFGSDLSTGLNRYLTSQISPDDPSKGNYTFQLDIVGYPELCIRNGESKSFSSGSWNGLRFGGIPRLKQNAIYNYYFVYSKEEIYYTFELLNSSMYSRFVLSADGIMTRYVWSLRIQSWTPYLTLPNDICDSYGKCGPYGKCNIDNSPPCDCLSGTVPKVPEEWNQADWYNGCIRSNPLSCHGDGFKKFTGLKLPDTQKASWLNTSMSLDECAKFCLKNCSCMAYAALDISNGASGCLMWHDELIDIRVLSDPQQDLYVRMSKKDSDEDEKSKGRSDIPKMQIIVSSSVLFIGMMMILCISLILYRRKKNQKNYRNMRGNPEEHQEEELDLPYFDMATLISATNNFSTNNILGKGGFGAVYKGVLEDGREIAVKRLSEDSRQGLQEFKSEVMHVVKLQHRNLVRLLGCCIQAEERILVYEFMPNKSLDYFIFDEDRGKILDWPKRFIIIIGIARGLLYLHQDSRHRIVHRDLKAGNVLLDEEINAKISDFGLARTLVGNENEANTATVVGTYGYLSPEYLIDGIFSTKSDVYSFGVLVLEIVTGKRNRGFNNKNHGFNLLGHVWTLFIDGKCLEIVDGSIRDDDASNLCGVIRAIHVGLLCVQRSPEDRPSMSHALMMLSSEWRLPRPKMPGFFTERDPVGDTSSSGNTKVVSINEVTISELDPR